jgi:broad specificity phosphatase PhoE
MTHPPLRQASVPTVILVRHGSTALNEQPERLRGWQDVPLDENGRRQTADLSQAIAARFQPAVIYASNLGRALQTATALQAALSRYTQIIPTVNLRPWNLGAYTGGVVEEIKGDLAYYVQNKAVAVPGGESFFLFATRFMQFFLGILRDAQTMPFLGPIVLVTHTRNIRTACAWLEGGLQGIIGETPSSAISAEEDPIPPGGMMVMTWEGGWRATTENEYGEPALGCEDPHGTVQGQGSARGSR